MTVHPVFFLNRLSHLSCQHFDCLFLGGNKKHTIALIAFIDEIFEGLAGVARVIAINRNSPTIVGVLLQNFTCKACAENEEIFND